jgi:hypothetical protein
VLKRREPSLFAVAHSLDGGSAEARGLWVTQERGKASDVCTAGGEACSIDAAVDEACGSKTGEAGGVETTGDVPDVLWTVDGRSVLRAACTQVG